MRLPVEDIDRQVDERLKKLARNVRMPGFRPGKVPLKLIAQTYGPQVRSEVLGDAVQKSFSDAVKQANLRVAGYPRIEKKDGADAAALEFSATFEVYPEVKVGELSGSVIERPQVSVGDAEVAKTVEILRKQRARFVPATRPAQDGDRVTADFAGTIDGQPFEGGSGDDAVVLIGSNTFIPGFEDQLIGISSGETRTLKVTFPQHYMKQELAGKNAEFVVTAKSIEAPGTVSADDTFAQSLGLESLAQLRDAVKDSIAREHTTMSRQRLKRGLLDELDKMHKFEPPPTLVEEEFERVWKSVLSELETEHKTFADEGTTEAKAKEEYRAISERRVRLGLVLAEIGEKNTITVTEDELSRAVMDRARQFTGQEQRVWDYYRQNPQAVAALRAPIFEEKVVDFLLELANVTENKVSREELYKDDDSAA